MILLGFLFEGRDKRNSLQMTCDGLSDCHETSGQRWMYSCQCAKIGKMAEVRGK